MASHRPASTPSTEHPWDPYGPKIDVLVGQRPVRRYTVSLSMICHYSGFFSSYVSWPHVELIGDEDSVVRLPGDCPEIFERVMQYCVQRRFVSEHETPLDLTFDELIDHYSFALTRDMPLIQNAITDLFAQKIKEQRTVPDRWSLEYMWQQTFPGCALRALTVDLVRAMFINDATKYRDPVWNQLVRGESPTPDRLIDLMDVLGKEQYGIRVSAQTMARVNACYFHVHDDGHGCDDPDERFMGVGGRAEADSMMGGSLQRGGRGPHRGIGHPREGASW